MTAYLDVLARKYRLDELGMATVAAPPLLLTAPPQADPTIQLEQARAIRDAVADRGALLLRGRPPAGPTGAATTADQLFPGETVMDTGEHPEVEDREALYRPVPFAPEQTLLWHHENSFNAVFPHVLMFVCQIPASSGGGTTIVDSRLVYQDMPATDTAALAAHGVRYTRLSAPHAGRTWQQLYGTDDPAVARSRAAEADETLSIDGDRATIVAERPAFLPSAHGLVWFNQLLHWHPAALPEDLSRLVRTGVVPTFRNCQYGNGDDIDDEVVRRLLDAYRDREFVVDWQAGDILLVDNTVFAHGRRPFRGPREHFVRMLGRRSQPTGLLRHEPG
ncbi:TauD/TfdA family dioxygenase [Micromonospora sp. WMMA1976]|uniref:TauD/TfdA family dioxygenase n=1 Tax=Micromonospora sp. WMMA1976 TaxID=3014995 RepID=UPI00248BC9C7|nr:TauD/TfdA family dioxygenase [Micromonospora sp. WMMA1976]WBC01099.1 TauD/TfdA family dioxygenase [Micromonospora sp. WMMA1976]